MDPLKDRQSSMSFIQHSEHTYPFFLTTWIPGIYFLLVSIIFDIYLFILFFSSLGLSRADFVM